MRFKLLIGLLLLLLVEGGLMIFAFREIDRMAREKGLSPFSWKVKAFLAIVGLSLLVGIFSTGIFMIFEIELFWITIPIIISGLIAFMMLRRNLRKQEKNS